MQKIDIISEFSLIRPYLANSTSWLEENIREMLWGMMSEVHSIKQRLKSEESLSEKVSRPDRNYTQLNDVTDLVGFRIITYFEEGVHKVGKIIEKNFEVDYHNSVDKRQNEDCVSFGYRSLHYICKLPEEAASGSSNIKCLRFEIQVRTILQHAWAEIEHDLGYKSPIGLPNQIRRKFSRVASLLEIADEQFGEIRTALKSYENTVANRQGLQGGAIDKVTLTEYLKSDTVLQLDHEIAGLLEVKVEESLFFPDYLVAIYNFLAINTISQLNDILIRNKRNILIFMEPYFVFTEQNFGFSKSHIGDIRKGYSLLLLGFLILRTVKDLEIETIELATHFFKKVDSIENHGEAVEVARSFVKMTVIH